jgi:hypothetical protein
LPLIITKTEIARTNQNKQMLAPSPAQRTPENQELIGNHDQREKTKRERAGNNMSKEGLAMVARSRTPYPQGLNAGEPRIGR